MKIRLLAMGLVAFGAYARMAGAQPSTTDISPPAAIGTQTPSVQQAPDQSKPALVGSSVYIYSFLDVRETEFSPEVLSEIDQQLVAGLKASGTTSTVLRFKDSLTGASYAQLTMMPARGRSSGSDLVPVAETIRSNQDAERAFNAKYRLIEFPSNFEVIGAWRYYTIRWILIDCSTNRSIWSYAYSGRNMIWLSNGERADSRGKTIVDALLTALRNGKLL
ncbi:MAG TPA: hypothetical protein VME40_11770 [Caulobacteraceae bacterium]|nr:hypothetical protein [Caulobacteraceae bacterium]